MKVDVTAPKDKTPELTEEQKKLKQSGADAEKLRLMGVLLQERMRLVSDYKNTIRHTGGLLTTSMGYAYSRAINDVFKLLSKGDK